MYNWQILHESLLVTQKTSRSQRTIKSGFSSMSISGIWNRIWHYGFFKLLTYKGLMSYNFGINEYGIVMQNECISKQCRVVSRVNTCWMNNEWLENQTGNIRSSEFKPSLPLTISVALGKSFTWTSVFSPTTWNYHNIYPDSLIGLL